MNHDDANATLGSWQGYVTMEGYSAKEGLWALHWDMYYRRNEAALFRVAARDGLGRGDIDWAAASAACPWAGRFGLLDTESEWAVVEYLLRRMGVSVS